MKNRGRTYRKLKDEQGGVLITVLIVATVFAILGYITLRVSIESLDAADTHQHRISAQMVAEGGLETATARLRQGSGVDESLLPTYMEPSYALSTSDDILRSELLISGNTTAIELDTFPRTTQRTAYTFDTNVSTYNSDTDLIPGSSDDALYRYHDDFMFSEDYPGYEFSSLLSEGKLITYSIGEVEDRTGDETLFKFLTAEYPADQYTYDVREAGVTEPSKMAPYPIIQTEHPYIGPSSKSWSITYQQDPRHPGRSLTHLRLMANLGEVQIDAGDTLLVSGWLVDDKRFQGPSEGQTLGPYTNTTEVFTEKLETTTIGLFLYAADTPSPGMDYGFKIKGVRYNFDMDRFLAYYETPHPYDEIIPQITRADLNIQVIFSPFQAEPMTAEFFTQQMRIQFSPEFSLDDGDTLFLFHAGDDAPVAPIVYYNSGNPIPSDYYTPAINRLGTNPDLPLGFLLLLARTSGSDTDGVDNYGYKIAGLEYTDDHGAWVRAENPIMESPHSKYLASNNLNYSFPAFPPIPPMLPGNYVSYQTIYRPFCPNTDDLTGIGTIDNWYVEFSGSINLSITDDGANNSDYIRIYTPGNIIRDIYDNVHFAALGSANDLLIQTPGNNWYNIDELKGAIIDCGIVEKMEIEFFSDSFDGFDGTPSNYGTAINYGLRIAEVGYTTSYGADDDDTPPTIRSDVNYPLNSGYPAFGNAPLQRTDWWYTFRDATLIGLHFDRYNFDIEPGDRIEIYDEFGILIATLLADSAEGGPEIGNPLNPDEPSGQQQGGWNPIIGDPYGGAGVDPDTIVDLHATYGWVLIPGTTAQLRFVGDGDDNEGYSGFELDRVGYIEGTGGIMNYITEYQELAYGQYYDRTSEPMSAFRSLGMD